MNGDAKSPQHTVVHPMYVSYSSIPTSASATMLSNKHHNQHTYNQTQIHQEQPLQLQHQNNTFSHNKNYHPLNHYQHQHLNHHIQHPNHHIQHPNQNQNQQQQQTINLNNNYNNNTNTNSNSNSNSNSNTFLIHTNNSNSSSNSNSNSNSNLKSYHNSSYSNDNNTTTPSNAHNSKNNTLTRILYSPRNIQQRQMQQKQQYYDDSTAKADQLYTHSNRRQFVDVAAAYQQHIVAAAAATAQITPGQSTTPSLSYASLQNSNLNLGTNSPLSNSNYSLTNSINHNSHNSSSNNNNNGNYNMGSIGSNNRFARINTKPRPPKSNSYGSFKSGSGSLHGNIKYTQITNDRQTPQLLLQERNDDDNYSLHNFKTDDGKTYIPFQNTNLYTNNNNNNNNASYVSLISPITPNNSNINNDNNILNNNFITNNNHNNNNNNNSNNINNNTTTTTTFMPVQSNEVLLENGAVLYPVPLTPAARFMYQQQNGLPPKRPTNIPLPSIPSTHSFNTPLSPSEVTPPPPPAPRPHIFQPRSGHAPFPDLSPEVTEKYAMPTQYIPSSPLAARLARRQRQQNQNQHQHQHLHQNQQQQQQFSIATSHFCDQIRDAPPGYIDTGFKIVRARSHDRLSGSLSKGVVATITNTATKLTNADAAPHVNRRSGRRNDARGRPRSYCNSMVGGEGVVRKNIAADREQSAVVN